MEYVKHEQLSSTAEWAQGLLDFQLSFITSDHPIVITVVRFNLVGLWGRCEERHMARLVIKEACFWQNHLSSPQQASQHITLHIHDGRSQDE